MISLVVCRLWHQGWFYSPDLFRILMDSAVAAELGGPSCVEDRHLRPTLKLHRQHPLNQLVFCRDRETIYASRCSKWIIVYIVMVLECVKIVE